MKLGLLSNLLVFMGLGAIVVGVISKFNEVVILFPQISPLAHLVFGNTCLLLVLILKLAND